MAYFFCHCVAWLGERAHVAAILPLAIDGLGKFTKIGSAILIMGIAGEAIIPKFYAKLALQWGPPRLLST